jgi:hypothetical protein
MAAPIGAEVGLTYDWPAASEAEPPDLGDVLLTRAGTAYLIHSAREGRTVTPADNPIPHRRMHYRCVKIERAAIPPLARVEALIWYSRDGKRRSS